MTAKSQQRRRVKRAHGVKRGATVSQTVRNVRRFRGTVNKPHIKKR